MSCSHPLPGWLREAVRIVARRRNVDTGWVNDATAQNFSYQPPAEVETIFAGEHIRILASSNQFLLGMKVLAARGADQEDALWLMQRTGMYSEGDLHDAALMVSLAAGAMWDPSQRQLEFMRECVQIAGRADANKAADAEAPITTDFPRCRRARSRILPRASPVVRLAKQEDSFPRHNSRHCAAR